MSTFSFNVEVFFFCCTSVFSFYLMQLVFTNECKYCKISNPQFINAMFSFLKMKDKLLMI